MAARKTVYKNNSDRNFHVIPLFDNQKYQESQNILMAIEENLKSIDENLQKLSFMNRELNKVTKRL